MPMSSFASFPSHVNITGTAAAMAAKRECGWSSVFLLATILHAISINCDLIVESNGYASYTQKKTTSDINYFTVEFKTKDPSGLLLHAKGGSDFVTLELVKGKLRYAANFGTTVDSYGESSSGFHEFYVGQNLANNNWHTILMTLSKEKHRVYLLLDEHRETKVEATRTMPPGSSELSIEYVHTGGMKYSGRLSKIESLSQKGIQGCFRKTFVNGKSVITGSSVTLIKDAREENCNLKPYFNSIDFPINSSYVSYNFTGEDLMLSFGIKANLPNQPLISYVSQDKSTLVSMNIEKDGRVSATAGGRTVFSDSVTVHDSHFHEFTLSMSSVAPFKMELTVDKHKSSVNLPRSALVKGKRIYFGKGFIGCMMNIMVGSSKLLKTDFDKYGPSNKMKPLFGSCSLRELCVPNPCLHGGKCTQIVNSFKCDCTTAAGYKGSVCNKPMYSRSCSASKEDSKGNFASGQKYIDVDGIGPLSKIKVECDYTKSAIVTKVRTQLDKDFAVENQFGMKSIEISYDADKRSMHSIATESKECRQFVRYSCTKSALFQSPKGPAKVRWSGPADYFHYYWGGSRGKKNHCSCGYHNNCTNAKKYCNCDARSNKQTQDEGYLINKKHLPMNRIEFLDVNQKFGSKGRFTLGPLECSGEATSANAVSFRDIYAILEVEPTSVTDYNNAIDAMTVSFKFKTTTAAGVMFYGSGRLSPDYIKVTIQSKTLIRAEINLGSKADFVDVDISSLKRSFDDNELHTVSMEFNRKELSFVVDGVSESVNRDPMSRSHLDLDGQSMYLGGGYGITEGFIGCIQGLFINGKLIDIKLKAKYMERYGVYAGCGIGCNRPSMSPCNFGKCIEKYSSFSCDCSSSPFDGKHCHKASNPLQFKGEDHLMYTFAKPMRIKQGEVAVAFKTSSENGLLFSIHGDKQSTHLSLVIQGGRLKLMFNFDVTNKTPEIIEVTTAAGKNIFNDSKLHSLKIFHNRKVSVRVLDGISKLQERSLSSGNGLSAVKISIASVMAPLAPPYGVPNSYSGCMSAFKYIYIPNLSTEPVKLDIFAQYIEGSKSVAGKVKSGPCGLPLPTPDPLPAVQGRPTKSPDHVVPMPRASPVAVGDMSPVIIALACCLAILLIVVLVLFCRHINRNLGAYKTYEDQKPLTASDKETSFSPAPECTDGGSPSVADSSEKTDGRGGKKQEWFV